jgi:WD40 repeat protein
VSFAPDGKQIVSAGQDGTIRLWDVASGKELRKFLGHTNSVYNVVFAPDGQRLLSCSADKTVRLWDVATGKQLQRLEGHRDYVWSIAFSPDGKRAASGGGNQQADGKIIRGEADYAVRLWDLETGREWKRLQGHHGMVASVVFTRDGRRLVSASSPQFRDETDFSVRLWDLDSTKELKRFEGHRSSVQSLAVSPDGRHLLFGAADYNIRVWTLPLDSQSRAPTPRPRRDQVFGRLPSVALPDPTW